MDRIAVISDIHGNLEALETVLEDIRKRNINTIFCLGDVVAKGSHPQECVDLVKENCKVIIKGNCEEYLAEDTDLSGYSEEGIRKYQWNKNKLEKETLEFLKDLPFCHEFCLSGRLVRLLHAHPQKIDRFTAHVDSPDRLYELFLPGDQTVTDEKADILIYGHIHTPFMQKIYNRVILNAGSVGNALDVIRNVEKDGDVRNTVTANYLILSGRLDSADRDEPVSYEFVSVPYDIEKELADSEDNIEIDSYSEELRNGKYRNMEKVYRLMRERGKDKDKI